jgi:hypothetical protein
MAAAIPHKKARRRKACGVVVIRVKTVGTLTKSAAPAAGVRVVAVKAVLARRLAENGVRVTERQVDGILDTLKIPMTERQA